MRGINCVNFTAIIVLAFAPNATASLITNGSFETVTPALSTNGICTSDTSVFGFYSACSATGWTGTYQVGKNATIGVFGVSFNIPQPDPDGTQALILQGSLSSATQSIVIPTDGLYTLTFYAANRTAPAGNNGPQTLTVGLNNTVLPGGVYSSLPGAWTLESLSFLAASGTYSLTFKSLGNGTADVSAFVDNVALASNVPEPSSLMLLLFALPAGLALRKAVAFTSSSGA